MFMFPQHHTAHSLTSSSSPSGPPCLHCSLEEQKGVDIMLEAIPAITKANKNVQIAILGTGKASMEKQLAALEVGAKGQAKGVVKFSAPLAHLITAGADFLLVPSRFEPCGLIQLHAMQVCAHMGVAVGRMHTCMCMQRSQALV